MLSRIITLQKNIQDNEAFLLSNPMDIKYFADFDWLVPAEREAFLLITKNSAYLIHATFSPVKNISGIQTRAGCYPHQVVKHIIGILQNDSFTKIHLDAESMYVNEYQALQKVPEIALHNLNRDLIWQQRMIKDNQEISYIQKAIEISLAAFEHAQTQLKVGMTEKAIKDLLETYCKQHEAETMAFPTIVAFGPNAALPHHQPSDEVLQDNTAILIDFGAKYNGYCADMTRTIWFGEKPDTSFIEIKSIVDDAYETALQKLKTTQSLSAKDLDSTAREVIEAKGYGSYFIHTTGHGVGLDIHEPPSLNWQNQQFLEKNMVITIEPGIYFDGEFGYRYENTIIV